MNRRSVIVDPHGNVFALRCTCDAHKGESPRGHKTATPLGNVRTDRELARRLGLVAA